jgi:hypothetical protein
MNLSGTMIDSINFQDHGVCQTLVVILQLDTITPDNKVANPEELKRDLEALRSAEVDGVMVDCWWGLVEGKVPQQYDWSGYSHLFKIVREAQLKLQVVILPSLHFPCAIKMIN